MNNSTQNIIFAKNLFDKLINYIDENTFKSICINGGEGTGKTFIQDKLHLHLQDSGYEIIKFDATEISNSNFVLKDLSKKLFKAIATKTHIRKLSDIYKRKDLKQVIKSSVVSSSEDPVKFKKLDKDNMERKILTDFICELNKIIKENELKIAIQIDGFDMVETFSLLKMFQLCKYIKKYLNNSFSISTINLKRYEDILSSKETNEGLDKYFDEVLSIEENINNFHHSNVLIDKFIKENEFYNFRVIDTIDDNLTIMERFVKNSSYNNRTSEFAIALVNELELIGWYLYYLEFSQQNIFKELVNNLNFLVTLKSKYDFNEWGNKNTDNGKKRDALRKFITDLEDGGYVFGNKDKFVELIEMIENPFKYKQGLFFTISEEELEKKYNLNHYYILYLFNSRAIKVQKYDESKDESGWYVINLNDLSESTSILLSLIKDNIKLVDVSANDIIYYRDSVTYLVMAILGVRG